MSNVAAAITMPVTTAVKQENSSTSFRTTLMAASPCGPWFIPRAQRSAHLYRGRKVFKWNFGTGSLLPTRAIGFRIRGQGLRHARAMPLICASPVIGGLAPTGHLQMEIAPSFLRREHVGFIFQSYHLCRARPHAFALRTRFLADYHFSY